MRDVEWKDMRVSNTSKDPNISELLLPKPTAD